jgi:hypothetical protein
MSKYDYCPNPKCGKKGYHIVYGYDPNPERGPLERCKYCGYSVRTRYKQDYRGYTLTVAPVRKGPTGEDRYDGMATKGEDESKALVVIAQFSSEEAIEALKRRVDYWEGIEDIEDKTNEELADYLVDDLLSDLKIDLNAAQSRFLLEVADRKIGELAY